MFWVILTGLVCQTPWQVCFMHHLSQSSQLRYKVGPTVIHLANKEARVYKLNFLPVAMQLLSGKARDRIPVWQTPNSMLYNNASI